MSGKTALLIIDVQVGMFENPDDDPVYEGDKLLANIQTLLEKARAQDIPVIYIQHNGRVGDELEKDTPGWHIHPAIAPTAADLVIQKPRPDSFHETTLHEELQKRGIEKLVVAGIQTDYCVDTTCRRASSLGYDLTLVEDGHSTWGDDHITAAQIIAHHNSIIDGSFGRLVPTVQITFD